MTFLWHDTSGTRAVRVMPDKAGDPGRNLMKRVPGTGRLPAHARRPARRADLDLGHVVDVLSLVREVAAAGRTVVLVQHDLAAVTRYADTVAAMKDGRAIATGAPRDEVPVRELYSVVADILLSPGDASPV